MPRDAGAGTTLDLAIIGAGVAGSWLAKTIQVARPEWTIALAERSDRIGGRLRSVDCGPGGIEVVGGHSPVV